MAQSQSVSDAVLFLLSEEFGAPLLVKYAAGVLVFIVN